MSRILITQSNYIPWKGYFENISLCDEMVIYDDMQYTKRDWRNRNRIKTQNGLKWLTIPVEVKGRYHQKINETLVSDSKWGENHLKQLEQWYSKLPHYAEIIGEFEDYFLHNEEQKLTSINQFFIQKINGLLDIDTRILRSEEFNINGDKTERLINICLERGANEYLTGPAAQDYMDEQKFEENGIRIIYADYSKYGEYEQPFGPFEHSVTILDAMFSVGANFDNILNKK